MIVRGVSLCEARTVVARRAGISPGTLENLRNGRIKIAPAHLYEAVRRLLIRQLETEAKNLEHEIALINASRLCSDEDEISEVATSLQKIRGILEGCR